MKITNDKSNNFQYSQETMEELQNVLSNCTNTETENKILKKISDLEEIQKSPIEYLAKGQNSVVFAIKDYVLKFGRSNNIDNPFCIRDIETLPFTNDKSLRIMSRMDTSDITEEDTQYIYNELRKSGLLWTDAHQNNVGRLPNGRKEKSGLRIIDDENIEPAPKHISAFDVLWHKRADLLFREYNYQKSINPNFKLSDIKKIMKVTGNSITDHNNFLINKYNLHFHEKDLSAPNSVISSLKDYIWNEKHKQDNVYRISVPGYRPKLYKVYGEDGSLSHITKHNPTLGKTFKRAIQNFKNLLKSEKTLQLPLGKEKPKLLEEKNKQITQNQNDDIVIDYVPITFREQIKVSPKNLETNQQKDSTSSKIQQKINIKDSSLDR